ncbi:MAG: ABC transporter permease [Candidatus Hodarchaeota archaeon]
MISTKKKVSKNWITVFAATILIIIIFAALGAPLISPFHPNTGNLLERLQPPLTKGHLLGTDTLGRDLLSRIIYGARISIAVGVTAVGIAGTFGTFMGLISGFYRGWIDRIIMGFVDMQLSFPFVVLALTIAAILGASFHNIIITLALSSWVIYGRLVRGEVLAIKEEQYIQASYTVGLPDWRIITMHILPNVIPSVIVLASLEVGRMIIAEAAISFLGFGIQPPTPAWGNMLSEGRDYITTSWWLTVFPGSAIVIITLAVNLVGDALRDKLDPKFRIH